VHYHFPGPPSFTFSTLWEGSRLTPVAYNKSSRKAPVQVLIDSLMDHIIAKINKMLELARRGGTEAESETARKMADELLSKYSLLIANINTATSADDYMFDGIMVGALRATWQDSIYTAISKLYSCTYFKRYDEHGSPIRTIVGSTTDVEVSKKVSAHLVVIAVTLAKEAGKSQKFLRSFKKGFACRIWARVDERMIEENRGSLTDAIPEMKKVAESEAQPTPQEKDEQQRLTDQTDHIDRRAFNKGSSAASIVNLELHDFLRK
jgi:hypothetical protein